MFAIKPRGGSLFERKHLEHLQPTYLPCYNIQRNRLLQRRYILHLSGRKFLQAAEAMTLQSELTTVYNKFHKNGLPEMTATIRKAAAINKETFDLSSTVQVGDEFPSFTLPDALGNQVSSSSLLYRGPLLLTFYRGDWCPFCNIMLRAMESHLPQIHAKGASFVAISPELPDIALITAQKNELKFPVLSDVGNIYARKLGIVFKQSEILRPVFKVAGIEWEKSYGNDAFEVPVPTTLLVDEKGVVRNVFLDTDYSIRLEPETALKVSIWRNPMNKMLLISCLVD